VSLELYIKKVQTQVQQKVQVQTQVQQKVQVQTQVQQEVQVEFELDIIHLDHQEI